MIKYVIYYRVSTKRQGDSGLGLAAQKRDINLFLENYSSTPYEVLQEFTEIESGTNSDRPELQKAIKLAKAQRAILLVSKLDRLSRKVSFIASLLDDKKLEFKVAQMPHADKFQLHIYAALAEQERDFISTRTKSALKAAKERGVKLGRPNGTTTEANMKRQKHAQEAAQKLSGILKPMIGNYSLQEMADTLNNAGIQTARGSEFKPMTVKRVLDRLELVPK
ncbi:Site-specific DNA recombinase [Microbulbifer donghaiensis]|uniref:Site-specific DNA recombinase n=1 Tax=Microbulbifer donghaiensis TaxID=494016 RepID=A0A1M4VFM7_9GAMM|nr:recombinase family protein [Microbulbifer donghaiensis]SHE67660.1 Site-specific DNA recombinase [Microbulbifer donghaiensis]